MDSLKRECAIAKVAEVVEALMNQHKCLCGERVVAVVVSPKVYRIWEAEVGGEPVEICGAPVRIHEFTDEDTIIVV